jgi:hypothetical protein
MKNRKITIPYTIKPYIKQTNTRNVAVRDHHAFTLFDAISSHPLKKHPTS